MQQKINYKKLLILPILIAISQSSINILYSDPLCHRFNINDGNCI